MKLDREFARELKKVANGDGSREAKFAFLDKATDAADMLSTTNAAKVFDDAVRKYGRCAVAVCVAATVIRRRDRLDGKSVRWATEVLGLWTNRPASLARVLIDDNLHPTRIEEYAGPLMRLTTEED